MKPLDGVEKQRNERGSHNENLNRGTAPICRAQHMGVSTSRLSNQIEINGCYRKKSQYNTGTWINAVAWQHRENLGMKCSGERGARVHVRVHDEGVHTSKDDLHGSRESV